jgi:hypothetical protein
MLSVVFMAQASAQPITHHFQDVTMPEALRMIERHSHYTINFIYNDLEDFRVTANVKGMTVPQTIRQLIGFYPIQATIVNDSVISVECTQDGKWRYKGRVVDGKGRPFEFANITLRSLQDSSIIAKGVSNENGFFVIPCNAAKVMARISDVGYQTVEMVCSHQDMGAIRLLPSRLTLQEVTVKSRQKIHKIDNDVFIPTALQKKVSMDGYDLLRNMAIPQLNIDAITNETTVKGKAVTFIVDNHIVTNPNDIKQLSPNDILKVEYNAMPTGEYAQYDCIVKFTTKRKNRGGNIMVSGMQGLNKNGGDVNGVVRFYKQRYEHSLAYAESHSHDEDSHADQTEHFVYPNGDELEKGLVSNTSSQKKRSSNLFYNFHYYGDSATFNVRLGYLFRRPETSASYLTRYKGAFERGTTSQETSKESSYSPYLSFSSRFQLRNRQRLSFRGSLDYSNNRFDYLLKEGAFNNSNFTKEHYYRLVLGSNYTKVMNKGWTLTGALYNFTENSRMNYLLNQTRVRGGLTYSETLLEMGISKRWAEMIASLDGGISQLIYKIRGDANKYRYSPRVSATVKYTLTPSLYVQYRGSLTNSYPTMTMYNNIEQDIDSIQKRRGNPNLKPTTIVSNTLNVNCDVGSWSFYAMYDMFISWKNNAEFVSYDNGYFIHSLLSEGHYYYTNPEIGLSYSKNGLLVKTRFGAEHYQITGRNGLTDTEWYNKSSISYAINALNIGVYYTTYLHGVYATLEQWSNTALYGLTVSYKYKGIGLQAGCQNPFTDYRSCSSLLTQDYGKRQYRLDNLRGKFFYLKASISLNFGNKKHSYTDVETGKSINSAIMKSGI